VSQGAPEGALFSGLQQSNILFFIVILTMEMHLYSSVASSTLESQCLSHLVAAYGAEHYSTEYASHRDLRSIRSAHNHVKQSAKYYGFRGVDPKWVGQPYDTLWREAQTFSARSAQSSATTISPLPWRRQACRPVA
jgi:hypothetical protein